MSSNESARTVSRSIRRHALAGGALAVLLVGVAGGWASVTEIESAVIAPATVVVASSRKQVQHDTGGIVERINVENGDLVEAGDVIIRLDGDQVAAEIAALEKQRFDFRTRQLRLQAERDGLADLPVPSDVERRAAASTELQQMLEVQANLLKARLEVQSGRRDQLGEQVKQLLDEIIGLEETNVATSDEIALLREELEGLEKLRKKKLVGAERYNTLRRDLIEKQGLGGRTTADIARLRGRISETRLQIIDVTATARGEVLKELESVEAELGQLSERLLLAYSRQSRLDIKASVRGHIHELAIHTIGGVVRPGDTLAFIVPAPARLTVDANVQTIDRDQIYPGMKARVRFTAFSQRTTPELEGRLDHIASDQSGGRDQVPPFYSVRVALPQSEIDKLRDFDLVPGMPAEVMMTAQPRTVLSYLTKPITDQFNRAFRDE